MNLGSVILRCAIAYGCLLLLIRISGKRTVRQGTPMDFVVSLILGDMVDNYLWQEVALAKFVTGTSVVLATHVLATVATLRSPVFAGWIEGRQQPVIEQAEFVRKGMRTERINEYEVESELRGQGIRDLREVKAADVELSGRISVLKEDWAREAQEQDAPKAREQVVQQDGERPA